MHFKPFIKPLLDYFSTSSLFKDAGEAEKIAIKKEQNFDSYKKIFAVASVFLFIQIYFIISDIITNFYDLPYTYLNLTAEIILSVSSIAAILSMILIKDKKSDKIGIIQFVYYFILETGILFYIASDILRDLPNISNAFYNMVLLAVFAVYSFKFVVILTGYIAAGTLTFLFAFSDEIFWPNLQLMILLFILFFACANFFRAQNTRYFLINTRNEIMQSKLRELSTRDFLTKLPNRTSLNVYLNNAVKDAITESLPIALMMVDIDDFKSYNDYHSHMDGDNCLRKIGLMLLDMQDENFKVFRYGGEEFLVIGINVLDAKIEAFAMNIVKSVENLRLERFDGVNESGYITASVGCAEEILSDTHAFSVLLKKADSELYRAKSGGKNRAYYKGKHLQ